MTAMFLIAAFIFSLNPVYVVLLALFWGLLSLSSKSPKLHLPIKKKSRSQVNSVVRIYLYTVLHSITLISTIKSCVTFDHSYTLHVNHIWYLFPKCMYVTITGSYRGRGCSEYIHSMLRQVRQNFRSHSNRQRLEYALHSRSPGKEQPPLLCVATFRRCCDEG